MSTSLGIIAILMWGALALLSYETTSIPPFQLLFLCFSIAACLPFSFQVTRWISQKASFNECLNSTKNNCLQLSLRSCLLGVYGLFGFHLCYFVAVRYAPAVEVSLISYLWPVLLALFVSRRAQLFSTLCGSLLGFVGVALLLLGNDELVSERLHNSIIGYGLAMLCALIWSSYSYFIANTKSTSGDTGWVCLLVALLSLIVHLITETSNWQNAFEHSSAIIMLGLGPVGGAFYLWQQGLQGGNRLLLASLSYFAPLLSAALLVFAGINHWSGHILTALVLILLGGVVVNLSSSKSN
jgi:drug/metabolite transporter (DMT)-like permease